MTKVQMRRWFREWAHRGAAADFARQLGVSPAMVSMWLNGKRNSPDLDRDIPKLISNWRKK